MIYYSFSFEFWLDGNWHANRKVKRFVMKKEWGFNKLISLFNLYGASNGFLVNDCCAFWVDIFVMDFNNKNDGKKGEILSLIKQPTNYYHSWKFTNFSLLNKDHYESQPFTVQGYNWYVKNFLLLLLLYNYTIMQLNYNKYLSILLFVSIIFSLLLLKL